MRVGGMVLVLYDQLCRTDGNSCAVQMATVGAFDMQRGCQLRRKQLLRAAQPHSAGSASCYGYGGAVQGLCLYTTVLCCASRFVRSAAWSDHDMYRSLA